MRTAGKFLVVESTDDNVALVRKKRFRNCAALRHYEVSYVFAIKRDTKNLYPGALLRAASFGEEIPLASIEEVLFRSLMVNVILSAPQLILIYTGFVFNQFYDDYYRVIRRIKEQYPGLLAGRFGADTEAAHDAPDGIFDRSREIRAIEAVFSSVVLGGVPPADDKGNGFPPH